MVKSTQEIYTIKLNLNFSDDPFKTYTCQARKDDQILAMKSMDVRNPFFLESHGDCGAQLAKNENLSVRGKRSPISGNSYFRRKKNWICIFFTSKTW